MKHIKFKASYQLPESYYTMSDKKQNEIIKEALTYNVSHLLMQKNDMISIHRGKHITGEIACYVLTKNDLAELIQELKA